ncbi:hypothetical protein CDAR_460381 [Caerostris darwini]|uniref:Uncharacterized protein n=1 Tax=Caerostris darwini TaxID=1538125 RepID=A0AAV4PS68_9ARAC|nr:hypothetical protein CDAR_460381 [Caerostris darwini]
MPRESNSLSLSPSRSGQSAPLLRHEPHPSAEKWKRPHLFSRSLRPSASSSPSSLQAHFSLVSCVTLSLTFWQYIYTRGTCDP